MKNIELRREIGDLNTIFEGNERNKMDIEASPHLADWQKRQLIMPINEMQNAIRNVIRGILVIIEADEK